MARCCWLLLVVLAAGCQPSESPSSDIAVIWDIRESASVGQLSVAVTLTDSLGRPIRNARVEMEGVMTHPGMQPVLAEAPESAPGRYEAILDLTMGGDWILLMNATLPDGRAVQRQKDLPGVRVP